MFYPNTTRVEGTVIETSYDSLRIPKVPIEVTNVAASFFSGLLGFFIPLMAIIGSYSSYGKDRLTGVLESVLARPVTRLSLGVSRYLSTMIAFVLAVAASVGVVDLILDSVGAAGDLPLILCEPCAIPFIGKRVCSTVILWTLDSSVCLWDNTASHNSRWAPMGHRSVHHIPHSCCQARLGKRSCPNY